MIVEKIKSGNGYTTLCKCDYCGKTFNNKWALAKRAKNQFCCKNCHGKSQLGRKLSKETKIKISLSGTGKKRSEETKLKMSQNHANFNGKNNPNYGKDFSLENSPRWKGGRIYSGDGYILIKKPEHSHADNQGYVKEHRLVMEEFLGRFLTREEVVHHEGEKDDNRIEKLRLFKNSGEHRKYHNLLKQAV